MRVGLTFALIASVRFAIRCACANGFGVMAASPLGRRDGNATSGVAGAKGAAGSSPTVVSGEAFLSSLLRPLSDSHSGEGSSASAVPVASALQALRTESRHEVVALLPPSRSLTMNWTNWHRLRDEAGSVEDPTLVISILGAWRGVSAAAWRVASWCGAPRCVAGV